MHEQPPTPPQPPPDDRFERYFAEKLWAWIPGIHRDEDGKHEHVLRALIEAFGAHFATLRRSSDRLWENAFIELCDDASVADLAQLVATRLLPPLNRRARRVDVARTIFYRRRKGTPRVIEHLVRDITGWDGALVEAYTRVARARHGLDPLPDGQRGRVTGSPPGGFADLRSPRLADLVDGPFDELAHTPDLRQLRGHLGRYNLARLNIHLYRQVAYRVQLATPVDLGLGRYTVDPSGRDVPLHAPARRSSEDCAPALEWELPAPMPCRLLGEAAYLLRAEDVDALVIAAVLSPAAADVLRPHTGQRFRHEARLRETLATLAPNAAIAAEIQAALPELLHLGLTPDSAKAQLYPEAIAVAVGAPPPPAPLVPHERMVAGDLEAWGAGLVLPPDKQLVIDPARGRLWFPSPPGVDEPVHVPRHHVGLFGDLGAGTYDRRDAVSDAAAPLPPGPLPPGSGALALAVPSSGVHRLGSSRTYLPDADVLDVDSLRLEAASGERPYVLRRAAAPPTWRFAARAPVPGESRTLVIDGWWIGVADLAAAPAPGPCTPTIVQLSLDGEWDLVVLRHVTLDPGGEKARVAAGTCEPIPAVQLLVNGVVEELIVERSILGPIAEAAPPGGPHGRIHRLFARDSVFQSRLPGEPAIATELGELDLARVTVLGDLHADKLEATETLVTGVATIIDNQHGCFRFGAAAEGSQLPPRFESELYAGGVPAHALVSRRFGDPGYAQLAESAPRQLRRGAENGGEIGVWNRVLAPIKTDDLRAKVDELAPFGLIAQLVPET